MSQPMTGEKQPTQDRTLSENDLRAQLEAVNAARAILSAEWTKLKMEFVASKGILSIFGKGNKRRKEILARMDEIIEETTSLMFRRS